MSKEKVVINKMPTKETLEDFVNGLLSDECKVVFNSDKGEFEYIVPREEKLGEPKTEFGRKLREMY